MTGNRNGRRDWTVLCTLNNTQFRKRIGALYHYKIHFVIVV